MPHIRSRFIRHQFRPPSLCSRHVTEFHTTPVAHASVTFCNIRHRLSVSFGRVSLQAPPSRHAPSSAHPLLFFPCFLDASRPPNKETPYLFLSRDHKAAAAAARRRRERLVAVCVVCVLSSCVRDCTSFIRAHALSLFEPLGSHSCLSYIL